MSVKQVSVDGRLFYCYSDNNRNLAGMFCGNDIYCPTEIKDSEELEKVIELMMSIDEDDRNAMDFRDAVQSTVDKYSNETTSPSGT